MQVIRVEHSLTGWGMFRSYMEDSQIPKLEEILPQVMARHFYMETLLADLYTYDCEHHTSHLKNIDSYFCAYESIDQFEKWVTREEARELIRFGFDILLLEISEGLSLSCQVAFKKEHIVDKRIINDLFQ